MSFTSDTPARGVQLIDRSQWRAIAAVGFVAALALCVGVFAAVVAVASSRRPSQSPPPPPLHVACPPAPACPAIPPCAACPACPPAAPMERHRRD